MTNDRTQASGIEARPSPQGHEPDAHGQAALLLAESILHGLVEAELVTAKQAASIIRTAIEVKVEVAEMVDESKGRMEQSLRLLAGVERSVSAYETDGE